MRSLLFGDGLLAKPTNARLCLRSRGNVWLCALCGGAPYAHALRGQRSVQVSVRERVRMRSLLFGDGFMYSEEDMIEELRACAEGGRISKREFARRGRVSVCAVIRRFGSWNDAVKRAGLCENKRLCRGEKKGRVKVSFDETGRVWYLCPKRLRISDKLRYEVMKRDGFRCVLCGASPEWEDDVRLEIDHITPVSEGGMNVMSNLRTLCMRCNRGRGVAEWIDERGFV